MEKTQIKLNKQTKAKAVKLDSRLYAPVFDLDFLKPQPITVLYENELLTAEEKAEYYEDMVRNKGQKNSEKIAKHCREMAAKLKKKIKNIDPDEALPLLEKIGALEYLAYGYENPIPPEVLESQEEFGDNTPPFPVSAKQEAALHELALDAFKPKSNDEAGPKSDAEEENSHIRELKRQAKFWRNIHSWDAIQQLAYYGCGPVKPADWKEAMFVRGQKYPRALKVLSAEGRHSMMRLLQLAEMGNEDAARIAIEELEWFVRLLNLYAKTSPAIFKKVASQLQSWPVVYSPHPRLNQIPLTVAHQIGLGKDIDFEFSPSTRWNPNDLGCKIAMQLYKHVKKMRQDPQSDPHSPCLANALNLPDIKQSGAVKAWWTIAKSVLLNTYPTPEDNDVLRSLTKIKNRHKVRDKILECLENRFLSLFPKESR